MYIVKILTSKSFQVSRVVVMYGTTTGNSTSFAQQLNAQLLQSTSELEIETIDVASIEPEDHLVALANDPKACLVLIISTYTEGTPPESAKWFYTWLEESAKDFRYYTYLRTMVTLVSITQSEHWV